MSPEEVDKYLEEHEMIMKDFYKYYRPIGIGNTEEHPHWIAGYCVDCTMNGGRKNKPDYWPNDHK